MRDPYLDFRGYPELSLTELLQLPLRERLKYNERINRAVTKDLAKTADADPQGGERELVQIPGTVEADNDAVHGSPSISPRRTRYTTRLDSYVYPAPDLGNTDEEDVVSGPPPDPKRVPHLDDENDVNRPTNLSAKNRGKSSSHSTSTPKLINARAPKSGPKQGAGGPWAAGPYDLRSRAVDTTWNNDDWPPLSAPNAKVLDQLAWSRMDAAASTSKKVGEIDYPYM